GPFIATNINILGNLKKENIIDEYTFLDNTYILLKTDILIQTQFPEYILKALPEEKEKEAEETTKNKFERIKRDLMDVFAISEENLEFSGEPDGFATVIDDNSTDKIDFNEDQEMLEESLFDVMVDEISDKFLKHSFNNSSQDDNKIDESKKEKRSLEESQGWD
ncbi:MAG: hypothetical protein ACTSWN_06620, partial [Promethearchaeota archaeon]